MKVISIFFTYLSRWRTIALNLSNEKSCLDAIHSGILSKHSFLILFVYLWQTIFVSQWVHTKLTVAIILSLLLLLPAFTHAESIMCEVGLWREEDKKGAGVMRRRESVGVCQTPIPASLEKNKVAISKPPRYILLYIWQNEVVVCVMGSHPFYIFHLNCNPRSFSLALHQFYYNLSLI